MDQEGDYGLVMPFWIDTDGYTDRDREMFVCGVEFEMIRQQLQDGDGSSMERCIHIENESRIRMMCGKLGRACTITPSGYAGWLNLDVSARQSK